MKNSKGHIAMVGIAFIIAIGAMAGTAANAVVPTVGLGTAASFSVLAGTPVISSTDPSGPLTALGVALTAVGVLLLRGRPIRRL
jgi:hypothetical protein